MKIGTWESMLSWTVANIAALVAAALLPTGGIAGGSSMQAGGGTNGRRPIEQNYLPELKAIVGKLSARYGVRVAVDPLIFVTQPPRMPGASLTVEEAMDALATMVRG